jgi:hypothetical protein
MALASSRDVAGPVVAQKLVRRAWGQGANLALHPQGHIGEQHPGEREHIVPTLAQGGHAELDDLEPVLEILPEGASRHLFGQIKVGGRHQPDIDPAAPTSPSSSSSKVPLLAGPRTIPDDHGWPR